MKKWILTIFLGLLCIPTILYYNEITSYLAKLVSNSTQVSAPTKSTYTKDTNYLFVQNTDDFTPYSYQDLLNIIYTTINSGVESYTFYCPKEYTLCLKDVQDIFSQDLLLTQINDFTSPYYAYSSSKLDYNEIGEVTISLTHVYTSEEIQEINTYIDNVISTEITDSMNTKDKLKKIHDYIINHTKYDVERNQTGTSAYKSNTAYGLIKDGYATCNGYADLYALFLDKLGLENYRIASREHIWNAVKLDDIWYHVDLTWDDPVSDDNKDYLFDTYFLIDSTKLKKADGDLTDHLFDTLVYQEFLNN